MISLNLSKKLPILIFVTHLSSSNIYSYVIISTLSTLPTIVHNINQVILFKPHQLPSAASKQYFELTSSVLSTTSKQCFEQPAASFLVCTLIFIEYKQATPSFSFHTNLHQKSPHTKNLCEDVDARYHLNYREFPYRSVSQ